VRKIFMQPQQHPFTLVDRLMHWSATRGGDLAYRFLDEDGEIHREFTYGELDLQVRGFASMLRTAGPVGSRILLLHPPGAGYLIAFLACLYAGLVPVPAYPPSVAGARRALGRLGRLAEDAEVSALVTTAAFASEARAISQLIPALGSVRWIATDDLPPGLHHFWSDRREQQPELAFLQYTSGSTGAPKGVMVTHRNLMGQLAALAVQVGAAAGDRVLSWLPPYHDMGLIGGLLYPVYHGVEATIFTPAAFVKRPLLWLEAISRYRTTISVAPNFAYELCAQRAAGGALHGLDLSRWTLAMCGAEPIRVATLERFARAFGPAGFRAEHFYACYGMAETTLMVTGQRRMQGPRSLAVDAAAYRGGRVRLAARDNAKALQILSCGTPIPGHDVRIVDPLSLRVCADDEVGEIWLRGPCIAAGYWRRPLESAACFEAVPQGDPGVQPMATACALGSGASAGAFLRTGDLGFLHAGELYVSGRLKDLLVIHGRNLHPEDLEESVLGLHPCLRERAVVAFEIEGSGEEARLAVVQEVRRADAATLQQAAQAMASQLTLDHGVRPGLIVLARPHTIPRTSSGKVQRRECRALLASGALSDRIVLQLVTGVRAGGSQVDAAHGQALAGVTESSPA
jgi:acyl-CoA synthetase (AMP-forming)/AMP-acid ligase II